MLHKISQLCDKIDSLKKSADYLRELKYGPDKALVKSLMSVLQVFKRNVYWLQTINRTITNLTLKKTKS